MGTIFRYSPSWTSPPAADLVRIHDLSDEMALLSRVFLMPWTKQIHEQSEMFFTLQEGLPFHPLSLLNQWFPKGSQQTIAVLRQRANRPTQMKENMDKVVDSSKNKNTLFKAFFKKIRSEYLVVTYSLWDGRIGNSSWLCFLIPFHEK